MNHLPLTIGLIVHWLLVLVAAISCLIGTFASFFSDASMRLKVSWWLGIALYCFYVFSMPDHFSPLPLTEYHDIDWAEFNRQIFINHPAIHWLSVLCGFILSIVLFEIVVPYWPDSDRVQALLYSVISFISFFLLGYLFFGRSGSAYLVFAFFGFIVGMLADFAFGFVEDNL